MSVTDLAQWAAIVTIAVGVIWLFVCMYDDRMQ